MGGELFHADVRTGMAEPTVTFCSFANAPKSEKLQGVQLKSGPLTKP